MIDWISINKEYVCCGTTVSSNFLSQDMYIYIMYYSNNVYFCYEHIKFIFYSSMEMGVLEAGFYLKNIKLDCLYKYASVLD